MRIRFVEVQNFRKLKSVRIDFSNSTTLLVGANNSGKTSAMAALGHFLLEHAKFTTNDFTLSNWSRINAIGDGWLGQATEVPLLNEWDAVLPALDVWLDVESNEIHYVRNLVPTLDWAAGLLGVRLRFEPKDLTNLYASFTAATDSAKKTMISAAQDTNRQKPFELALWPKDLKHYLERRLGTMFVVRAYLLDPSKHEAPVNGIAKPQPLPVGSEYIDGNPFDGLIRIDEINAQRGLGDTVSKQPEAGQQDSTSHRERRRLSEQLRVYYARHIDPSERPEPSDLDAMEAIDLAEDRFDERLAKGFAAAIDELESLGYPGVTDPKLRIATKLRMTDGMNHDAAVRYEVPSNTVGVATTPLTLPEDRNGLGYQNLISIVFKLMSFRDDWMQVGKASRDKSGGDKEHYSPPPLHLVLIEEPEAHLHAQVQQVFIRKAYDVLRRHEDLGAEAALTTQLIISTHSSHIAHEVSFGSLRYFRRLRAANQGDVATSSVINLSEVFGKNEDTPKFVTRYLQTTHCDLFFADAAILVEGPTERMLVPHFIREHYPSLNTCYVTLLEIGGSHAHTLRPLIEHLGLTTLIIADLDSAVPSRHEESTPPKRGCNQLSRNPTLRMWHPKKRRLDDLLSAEETSKVKNYEDSSFCVRVAHQIPLQVTFDGADEPAEALASTFEDSLVFENLSVFKSMKGDRMIKRIRKAISEHPDATALGAELFEILKDGEKAAFALDLLWNADLKALAVPKYIKDGLGWLEQQLRPEKAPSLRGTAGQPGEAN